MSDRNINWQDYLEVASVSDVGMRRANNQDSMAISMAGSMDHWKSRGHLMLVADGMGAHAAGELASKLAADNIPHLYNKYGELSAPEALKRAMIEANAEINRRGQANEDFYNMGTTCSVMTLLPQGVVVAHIGDSRVYRLRNGQLEQLTFDHSLVWEMRASGQFADSAAESVVPKNVITRSLGPYPDVKVDLEGPFPVEVGDIYMLCSDGLTGQIEDDELGPILSNLSPQEAARVLVDLSNLRGGPDNITLVIAKVLRPEISSVVSGSTPLTIGSKTGKQKINPLFWALLLASIVGTIICMMAGSWIAALVPGLIVLISLAWLVYQVSGLAAGGTPVTGGKRFGKGPYVRVDCASNKQFTQRLQDIVKQLHDELAGLDFVVENPNLKKLVASAENASQSGDENKAIGEYSRSISYMMKLLRDQNQQASSESKVDL
jgi:protein phosphatase